MNIHEKNDCIIYKGDCIDVLKNNISIDCEISLTFCDPPLNQNKEYENHNDDMDDEKFWNWMKEILELINSNSEYA